MRSLLSHFFLFLFLLFLYITPCNTQTTSSSTNDPVVITYVSTIESQVTSTLTGSYEGGTALYIQGYGFDSTFENNLVYVGGNVCNTTSKGVTQNNIVCYTTPYVSGPAVNLPITVLVLNKQPYTCSTANCLFSYSAAQTPYLRAVYPRSASFNSQSIKFYGTHKITDIGNGRDLGDIVGLYIGESICSMFDIPQTAISANTDSFITCSLTNQEGGYYKVKEWVVPGVAKNYYKMSFISMKDPDTVYQFVVHPTVVGVNVHSGGSKGSNIVISGTGFSASRGKVEVTVAGLPCQVETTTLTEIKCRVKEDYAGNKYGRYSTTITPQVGGYISGSGLRYGRYTPTNGSVSSMYTFKYALNDPVFSLELMNKIPYDNKTTPWIVGETQSPDILPYTSYGQHWRGYFLPPTTGNYTFRALADDACDFYINSTSGSEINLQNNFNRTLGAIQYSVSDHRTNYFYNDNAQLKTTNPIWLVAGEPYHMELYHWNLDNIGIMKLAVEVPNTANISMDKIPNLVFEVQRITFAQTVVPEIIQFDVRGGWNSGSIVFKMIIIDPRTLQPTYNVVGTLNFANSTAAVFLAMINRFLPFAGYNAACVLSSLDVNGVPTANLNLVYIKRYRVTLNQYRPPVYTSPTSEYKFTFDMSGASNTLNTSMIPTMVVTTTQEHSPPVNGSYSIEIGGNKLSYFQNNVETTDIPYDTSPSTLSSYFANSPLFGYKQLEIDIKGTGFQNGNALIFSFVDYKGDLPQMVVDASKLTGGATGTKPTATVLTHRNGSNNILFDPITEELLATGASTPQVLVKVNGVLSRCMGDCSYVVDAGKTPIVNKATLVGSLVKLNITTDVPIQDFNVKIGGQSCAYSAGESSGVQSYACNLPYNGADVGSPRLEAGVHHPILHVPTRGYADTTTNTQSQIDYPLTITSVAPTSGDMLGGLTVTITGSGFPIFPNHPISLNICSTPAHIISVTNTEIKFLTNPCEASTSSISLSLNNKTATSSFQYIDDSTANPTISSISPTSYSPVMKGFMRITGSGFGVNKNDIRVWLKNGDGEMVYELNVVEISDTELKVRIPGGEGEGEFKVVVIREGYGNAGVATTGVDIFWYRIGVHNIEPRTGSLNGGTILTITGENFSPLISENQVYIGNQTNWICDIISVTPTEIKCRTPPMSQNFTTLSQPVVVVGKAKVESACLIVGAGGCQFTYVNVSYPTVSIASGVTTYKSGESVTLSGEHFVNGGVAPVVTVGGKVAEITSWGDTEIVFKFPALENGTYNLNVEVDKIGYAYPTIQVTTLISVTGITPSSGSYIGNTIKIVGNGLGGIDSKYVSFNAVSSSSTVPFNYTVRTDNTPTQFGIDFLGCAPSAAITLNYYYKNILYKNTYTCQTDLTQIITIPGSKVFAYSAASKIVTFTRTSLTTNLPSTLYAYPIDTNFQKIGDYVALTPVSVGTTFTVDLAVLPVGKYGFRSYYSYNTNGGADFKAYVEITQGTAPTLLANVDSGFGGGAQITVQGTGLGAFNQLLVAGIPAKLVASSLTSLVYSVPPLVSATSQTEFKVAKESVLKGTPIADTATNKTNAFDKLVSTKYSSAAATCYIGQDFGASQQALITRIRYFPNPLWKSALAYIAGATIKASNDNTNWVTLATIDSTTHTGWNIWKPAAALTTAYRYVRFEHNSTSKCELAEFEVSGYLYAGAVASTAAETRDVTFTDGTHTTSFAGAVTYKASVTPVVTGVSPKYGSPAGNDELTLTGTGFGTTTANAQVLIDDIACTITTVTNTEIKCQTGARPVLPASNSFSVSISGNTATLKTHGFLYAHRWSDTLTWGGDFAPINGDTVYVPKGMVLLVDQTTPNLYLILVEGSIVFADEADTTVETTFLIVENGIFRAGTETEPYQHKLTFILHGDYYDTQLPGFGNKVIGCHSCTFDMHGRARDHTWTEIAQTVAAGQTKIFLKQPVDWQVGEEIVIASTNFDHRQAEQRTISQVSLDKKQITFTDPLLYTHIGVTQTYNSTQLPIFAQVALLTRNIKIQGDSNSPFTSYGAHLMMHGPAENGLISRISYSEFTQCGQPNIVGRYCIHFHMNGDVSNSFIRGNAVHQSYARVLTLHAVDYLLVQYNVGYSVRGHNIFLEDGIEQYNVIQYNLMISSLETFNMLQTDISVASYWITNPLNTVRYNRAAGSDFYGFWYEIKKNPDGASATTDICPTGLPLGESHHNVAHSNKRFGLRVFELHSSQNPCKPIRNDREIDPWLSNPSIQNKFNDYIIYRNGEVGVLGEKIGNTIFSNFVLAENGRAALEFYKTNYTKQPVIATNFTIIGQTSTTSSYDPTYDFSSTSGIITSRTDGSSYHSISFHNFPTPATLISIGSRNDQSSVRSTGCKNYNFSQISIANSSANYIRYISTRRYIINDLDGTLSGAVFDGTTRGKATILPYYPHNEIPGKCSKSSDQVKWDESLICDEGVDVNGLQFGAVQPGYGFQGEGVRMWVKRLEEDNEIVEDTEESVEMSVSTIQYTEQEQRNTWSLPFVSNYTYSVFWNQGTDWTSLTLSPSFYHQPASNAFIIRFNYTTHRQLFDISHIIAGKLQTPLLTAQGNPLVAATCSFGDYYLDAEKQFLFVCISGKSKSIYDLLTVNGIKCRYLCPKPGGNFTKQSIIRLWSNVSQWPGEVLPQPGDNITVNGNWTIFLDVDVENLNNITIDGDIYLTEESRKLSANFIWIRYGSLNAGNESHPFEYDFSITLNGGKDMRTYTIDEIVSVNKYLVVTGELNLYGKVPGAVVTRLVEIVGKGETEIKVEGAEGWEIGMTIGIAPSYLKSYQYESVVITNITGNTITFTPPLNYSHYGASGVFTNSYGTIDMRSTVGLLDRNIKIQGSPTGNSWSYGVVVYAWNDGDFINTGSANIRGVQFINGGQPDNSPLHSTLGILNTGAGQVHTLIEGSTFQHCNAYCLQFSNVNNATVTNNYIFSGRKFLTYAENVRMYTFKDNVLVGARNRSVAGDDIACYSQYTGIDWESEYVVVEGNQCQGSELTGFEFPHTPCQYLSSEDTEGRATSWFRDNVASSTEIGFLFSGDITECAGGERLKVYSSKIGVVSNPRTRKLVWDQLMIVDTARGIGLRFGGYDDGNRNDLIWRNSYVSAISRPTCSACYGPEAIPCTNMRAVRLLATSENTASLPTNFGDSFQTISHSELFDSQAWIYNTTFENYNTAYPGVLSTKCSSNMLFESHPLDDSSVGNHHFFNTTCTNCDSNALGYYNPSITENLGWTGGCGNILCTGRSNYIMYDHDGTLINQSSPGIILPNNQLIGNHTTGCTYNSVINGHICNRTDFVRLKYTSITSDYNSRITWPVYLSSPEGGYTTMTNGWREWDWNGGEPMNRRKGRFLSIVQLERVYNMTFESQPSTDMLFSFSLTNYEGNTSQWIGVKIYYPVPNAISVTHSNGSTPKTLLATDTSSITDYTSTCGANQYFYKNNTIHFIITGDLQCTVRVTLTSSIQVTIRLSVDITSFYSTIGPTTVLDQLTSFLNISMNRIKIVGVYSGSTVIDLAITPPPVPVSQANTSVPDSSDIILDLKDIAGRLANATEEDFPLLGGFLGATAVVNVMNVGGQVVTVDEAMGEGKDRSKYIIIGVVVGVVVLGLIGVGVYLGVERVRGRSIVVADYGEGDGLSYLGEEITKEIMKTENRSEFELRQATQE